jgi:mono/diheme cytochrome c family protein
VHGSRPLAAALALLLVAAALFQGCRSQPAGSEPRYALNQSALATSDELAVDDEGRTALEWALVETFGTPGRPGYRVLESWRGEGFDPNVWDAAEGGLSLRESARMFRQRCARCHGVAGGGDGGMASRLRTRPRDYRRGVFKNTPLADRARPRHEDLVEILRDGIPGTAMPAWGAHLTEAQLAGIAAYVRLLAIRGETERLTIFDYDADDGFDSQALRENYALVVDRWRNGTREVIEPRSTPPEPSPERIAHGRALFHGELGARCERCHGADAHGDGPSSEVIDPETGELAPFRDDWGHPIRPRDLVCSPFRFGDEPVDLFRRVYAGINGTPMPAHGGTLGEDDIWNLVLYVYSLRADE